MQEINEPSNDIVNSNENNIINAKQNEINELIYQPEKSSTEKLILNIDLINNTNEQTKYNKNSKEFKAKSQSISPTNKNSINHAYQIEELYNSVSNIKSSSLNPPLENIILTPRSALCCLRCGINPETLRIRELNSFQDGNTSVAVQKMRYEAYSQRRIEQMKLLRKEMNKITSAEIDLLTRENINEKQRPLSAKCNTSRSISQSELESTSKPQLSSSRSPINSCSFIELERKRLEKIQFRQKKEIEQMLEFELKMNKIQEDANRQIQKEQKLQANREKEKALRAKEMAEERRQRDLNKKAMLDAEEEKRKLLMNERYKKDKERQIQEAEAENKKRIKLRMLEEEKKNKTFERMRKTEAIAQQQQEAILQRLDQLKVAEENREKIAAQINIQRHKEMEERKAAVRERIEKNLYQAKILEEERIQSINEKEEKNRRNREKYQKELEIQRTEEKCQQEMQERRRKYILEEKRKIEEEKIDKTTAKKLQDEERLNTLQQEIKEKQILKREKEHIQQELKKENVERIKRIVEYKREEMMRKLNALDDRTKEKFREKNEIVKQRKLASIQSKLQKDYIINTMEKIKINKKWKNAKEELKKSINIGQSLSPREKQSTSPNKNSPVIHRHQMNHSESLPILSSDTNNSDINIPMQANISTVSKLSFKFTSDAAISKIVNEPKLYLSPYEEVPVELIKTKHIKRKS